MNNIFRYDYERHQTAIALAKLQLRAPVISSMTGLNRRIIWEYWRAENGGLKSPTGKLPSDVLRCLTSWEVAVRAATIVAIYDKTQRHHTRDDDVPNALDFIRAYDLLNKFDGALDVNIAYYAIRDVRLKVVPLTTCPKCFAKFFHDRDVPVTRDCPFCMTRYH